MCTPTRVPAVRDDAGGAIPADAGPAASDVASLPSAFLDRRVLLKAGATFSALAATGFAVSRAPGAAIAQADPGTTQAGTFSYEDNVGTQSLTGAPDGFQTPFTFTAVGAHWDGSVGFPVAVAMSFSADGVTYSTPVTVTASNDLGRPTRDGRIFADLVFTAPANYVRFQTADGSGNFAQVAGLSFTYLNSDDGPATVDAQDTVSLQAVAQPRIVSRAQWGADEKLRYDNQGEVWPPEYRDVEHVIIHHTDTPNYQDPYAAIRSIYYYHAITQGWGDIGYNYLVDYRGNIYEGRVGGANVIGGHAYQYAEGSSGIGVMGDFNAQNPESAALSAIVAITAYTGRFLNPLGAADFFQVPNLPTICAHRDVNASTCPGNFLYDDLPSIRQSVNQILGNPGGSTTGGAIAVGGTVRVTTDLLNLRSSASTSASVVATLPNGTTGTVLAGPTSGSGYTWWQLRVGNNTGWAVSTYLAAVSGGPASGFRVGAAARTNSASVNLRAAAGSDGAIVAVLASGTAVTIGGGPTQSDGDTWWFVRTTSNGNGWIAQRYLTLGGSGAGTVQTVYGTALTYMPVRSRPGAVWNALSNVSTGVQVQITDGPVQVEGQVWYGVYRQGFGGGWSLASQLRIPGVATPSYPATQGPRTDIYRSGSKVITTTSIILRPNASRGRTGPIVPPDFVLSVTGGATVAEGFAWWPVNAGSYGNGYVAGAYVAAFSGTVNPTPNPSTPPSQQPSPSPSPSNPTPTPGQFAVGSTVLIVGARVNVRSGPSSSAAIRGVAVDGNSFTVTGNPTTATGYTWYPVRNSQFGDGYVAGAFLKAGGGTTNPSPTPRPSPSNPTTPGQYPVNSSVRITEGPVNFRSGPTTSASIIALLQNGTQLTVTGAPQAAGGYTWYPVRSATYGNGWVVSTGLTSGGGTTTPNPTPTPRPSTPPSTGFPVNTRVRVTEGPLNVRSTPGTGAGIITTLSTGTVVTVTGGPSAANGLTWYSIRTASGTGGWVASQYIARA